MADGIKPLTNKTINIKLDDTNYLQWRQQIGFTIACHKTRRISGWRSACVEEWICVEDGSKIKKNPYYDSYK